MTNKFKLIMFSCFFVFLLFCPLCSSQFKPVVVNKLVNCSTFIENEDDWRISRELTADLKERLKVDFMIIASTKNIPEAFIVDGEIREFSLTSREASDLPIIGYKGFWANIKIELHLKFNDGKIINITSTKNKNVNKALSMFIFPDFEQLDIDDKVTDFDRRGEVKWGSEEFYKSVAGKAVKEVINDLGEKVKLAVMEKYSEKDRKEIGKQDSGKNGYGSREQ